jgi:putative transposase
MELIDPNTGEARIRKCRRRYDEPGDARELTFSCYRRFRFLDRDRTRGWFISALRDALARLPVELWAYVVMPEHVHLLVVPRGEPAGVSEFLRSVKEPVARRAIAYLREHAPDWLPRITVREGRRVRHRFWQPGGGYDRNINEPDTLPSVIDYIHNNPVRRGLVARPEDWEWSSARWYAGIRPVALEINRSVFAERG